MSRGQMHPPTHPRRAHRFHRSRHTALHFGCRGFAFTPKIQSSVLVAPCYGYRTDICRVGLRPSPQHNAKTFYRQCSSLRSLNATKRSSLRSLNATKRSSLRSLNPPSRTHQHAQTGKRSPTAFGWAAIPRKARYCNSTLSQGSHFARLTFYGFQTFYYRVLVGLCKRY